MKNHLILSLALVAALAACGDDKKVNNNPSDSGNNVNAVEVPKVDYRRLDRMGIPAVTSGLLVSDEEKDAYNNGTPGSDLATFGPTALERVSLVQKDVIPALGINAEPNGSVLGVAFANGDVIQIDPTITGANPVVLQDPNAILANGRIPGTDIIDLILTIVATNTVGYTISDGVNTNDKQLSASFPYLAKPQ